MCADLKFQKEPHEGLYYVTNANFYVERAKGTTSESSILKPKII